MKKEKIDFTTVEEFPYPRKGDELFKSDSDWHFNACVSFRFESSSKRYAYIAGFKRAGDAIFEAIRIDHHHVDLLVYPMVFNYRHFIELSLKDILWQVSRVLEQETTPKPNHFLFNLWQQCRPLLEERFKGDDPEVLNIVQQHIKRFDAVDPGSTVFRYPNDTKLTPAVQTITHINVRNLFDVMQRIANFFDGVSAQLSEDWDNLCEARSIEQEYQADMEAEWRSYMEAEYSSYEQSY